MKLIKTIIGALVGFLIFVFFAGFATFGGAYEISNLTPMLWVLWGAYHLLGTLLGVQIALREEEF